MSSFLELTARARIAAIADSGSFRELLPPQRKIVSPHLAQLDVPVSFDDGVVIGSATLGGKTIYIAAQEGGFMGGAVGEVHGAKLVGMLQRAVDEHAHAVVLLLDSGGVRLHEANAGLIAVSEVMRAVLDARAAGVPVVALIGGANGSFGGMGIVACCTNAIVISEEARLGMSGPEVIETANGVEEFDSRDRALVWRVTGGKHRYLMGEAKQIVPDDVGAFRVAAIEAIDMVRAGEIGLSLAALETEHRRLTERMERFGDEEDPFDIWKAIGIAAPDRVPLLDIDEFRVVAAGSRQPEAS